jgi:hypothetical protein
VGVREGGLALLDNPPLPESVAREWQDCGVWFAMSFREGISRRLGIYAVDGGSGAEGVGRDARAK